MGWLPANVDQLDITVSRGQPTIVALDFVDTAPGDVSLWVGGSLDDLDDTTGATEVVGSVASFVASFTIPAQTSTRQALRLERDGDMVTAGYLTSTTRGRSTPSQTYTVTLGSTTVQVSTASVSGAIAAALAAQPDLVDGFGTEQRNPALGETTLDVRRLAGTIATVSSTAAATPVATAVTIAANTITKDVDCFHIVAQGTHINNSAANRDLIFTLVFQGDTIATWTFAAVPASATGRSWRIEADWVVNDFIGSALVSCVGVAHLSGTDTGADFGVRTGGTSNNTIDLTASAAIVVNVQHATNASTITTQGLAVLTDRAAR